MPSTQKFIGLVQKIDAARAKKKTHLVDTGPNLQFLAMQHKFLGKCVGIEIFSVCVFQLNS